MRLAKYTLACLSILLASVSHAAVITILSDELTLSNTVNVGLSGQTFSKTYQGGSFLTRENVPDVSIGLAWRTRPNPLGDGELPVFDQAVENGDTPDGGLNVSVRSFLWGFGTEASRFFQSDCCFDLLDVRNSLSLEAFWDLDVRFRVDEGSFTFDLEGAFEGSGPDPRAASLIEQVIDVGTGQILGNTGIMSAGNTYRVRMGFTNDIIGSGSTSFTHQFTTREPVDIQVPAPAPLGLLLVSLWAIARRRTTQPTSP